MRSAGWIRLVAPLLGLALPLVVVGTLAYSANWHGPLPDAFPPGTIDPQSATSAAGSLTASLLSLAVGVIVGIGYSIREGTRTPLRLVIAAVGCGAAIASIYASYRFQSALSEQLFYYKLDFDRIRDRLDTQAWALLIAGSCLTGLFVQLPTTADEPAPPDPPAKPKAPARRPRKAPPS